MSSKTCEDRLPEDLEIVPASRVRTAWRISDAVLYRLERDRKLIPLRFGRRRYFSVGALRKFLDAAQQAAPISVPWDKPTEETNTNTTNKTEGQARQ
jgi:hypothetical protein